jgi:AraC family transcriptional regulator, transcriptional activator of pobA
MKQPTKLTMQRMFDALDPQSRCSQQLYYRDGLAIAIDNGGIFRPFILSAQSPFLLEDYRFGVITRGMVRGRINLQEYEFSAGMAVFVTPGTIVEPLEMSGDIQVTGLGISTDLFHIIHSGGVPDLFNAKMKNGVHVLNDAEQHLAEQLFGTLWTFANAMPDNREVVFHIIEGFTSYYSMLFANESESGAPRNNGKEMFDRFLQLVNSHCREQRQLAFYADKICVTERYLGTVIRQTSGLTAKEWIDKAVITQAKVMLLHSNRQIVQIAYELNFPNPSFFCKYFKRLVGCTPQEYRKTR